MQRATEVAVNGLCDDLWYSCPNLLNGDDSTTLS